MWHTGGASGTDGRDPASPGLGVAKALGDCIRIGAHHSLDRSTERTGPFRCRPERPRRAPDDDCNKNNNNDAAHTHDRIDKAPHGSVARLATIGIYYGSQMER